MRLDKFLANMGIGSRTEVKTFLKKGKVTVNDKIEKSPKKDINEAIDKVYFEGELVEYIDKIYLMLNKPKGYVSATVDDQHPTVIDLIKDYNHINIFPVGRLDKDTEGLLLITNDGDFNHQLMNPSKHVPKTYEVISKNSITKNDIDSFKKGIELHDGLTKPALLEVVDDECKSFVTIHEGRYHQVKRMFHAINNEVLALKRVKIGDLELDAHLESGDYRQLTLNDFKLLGIK